MMFRSKDFVLMMGDGWLCNQEASALEEWACWACGPALSPPSSPSKREKETSTLTGEPAAAHGAPSHKDMNTETVESKELFEANQAVSHLQSSPRTPQFHYGREWIALALTTILKLT